MNKYLKTYIRNRDIVIVKNQNIKGYELDYINIDNLDSDDIYSLLRWADNPQKVIDILGDKGENFIRNLDSERIRWF
jgi:hypothetical protein